MKKTLLFLILLMFSCVSIAQSYKEAKNDSVKAKCVDEDNDISSHKNVHDNDNAVSDSLTLNEVVVKSSRAVNTNRALRIFPTDKQKENSSTAYGLLSKLSLPLISVDEVAHTISAPSNMGTVQVRINDVEATKSDLASIDLNAVKYVDFIRNPGVRYGQNVGFVINIIVKKAVSGYAVGADLSHTLSFPNSSDNLFAKFNFGKSEISLSYWLDFSDKRKLRYEETDQYLMPDNSFYYITRSDKERRLKNIWHNLQLKYSFSETGRYVFQATLGTDLSNCPIDYTLRENIVNQDCDTVMINSSEKSFSPVLDLYYNLNIGKNQSVTLNATGTYSDASYSWSYGGNSPYSYTSDGDSWSLFAEGIYENRMRLFTFSSGLQYSQKYNSNKYLGDAEAINTIHNSLVYAFAQIKGNLAALEYTLGTGVSCMYYHQASDSYKYWLWRPELSLAYPFWDKFKLKYYLRMYQNPPRLEYLGDIDIRNNELEVSRGNSALFPTRVLDNSLTISYQLPTFYAEIETSYRNNYHCYMSQINRETDENGNTNFIFTRENQRRILMFYVNAYTRYDIIPDKLTFAATGGFFRFFNYGNTYKHHYSSFNGAFRATAYLGKFTISADASNGWSFLEGETRVENTYTYSLAASYKYKDFILSLIWQNGFQNDLVYNKAYLVNRYVGKIQKLIDGDMGNMLTFKISWHLSKGRKYEDLKHTVNNKDNDTGIIKGN